MIEIGFETIRVKVITNDLFPVYILTNSKSGSLWAGGVDFEKHFFLIFKSEFLDC